ncbi:MAG TPA: NUDIX hydrolase [Sulfurovum sp. UBA12169]|nr:MAG TPA: NUDIX hydrolase [Sulfurovum sp. UBA12169]
MIHKNEIENFTLHALNDAKFVKTALARYEQNGISKTWEVVQAHDSVAVLLYHEEKDIFVLVRQFRPAVYVHNNEGMSIELCAGIVDKEMTLEQIVQEEIEEECGYRVPLKQIKKITSFYTSVGFAGSKQTLYYTTVNDAMKVSKGGGVDSEMIEVVELPLVEAEKLMYDETIVKTPGLLFAFMWFFMQKEQCNIQPNFK